LTGHRAVDYPDEDAIANDYHYEHDRDHGRAKPQPPDFNRHGDEDGGGSVFAEAVTVMFENVEITSE
jgi:hypothetical protein